MKLPKLRKTAQKLQTLEAFGGYDRSDRIRDGFFMDMRNLTSDHYPLLAPRSPRGILPADGRQGQITAMAANIGLIYVKGSALILPDGNALELGLTPGDKQLVTMGAYVIILPDKKWVNVAVCLAGEEGGSGNIEHTHSAQQLQFRICKRDGEVVGRNAYRQRPEEAKDGDYWYDSTPVIPELKRWYADMGMWVQEECFLRVLIPRTGDEFRPGDALVGEAVTGEYETHAGMMRMYIPENPVVEAVLDGGRLFYDIVIPGIAEYGQLNDAVTANCPVTWSRQMPDMDFVIESGNRLWGCKWGKTDKGFVNEIYASGLGDFRNWHSFRGISTDSYWACVGTNGAFTGAVNYLGRPLFFKEGSLTQVYGTSPSNFRLQDMPCQGVTAGCHKSLAVLGNLLYYKSPTGVCVYDGSMPVEIGKPLGTGNWENAVAAGLGHKYYISMAQAGQWGLFVYDADRGLWHKEDALCVRQLLGWDNRLYGIDQAGENLLILCGAQEGAEPPVSWMAQTGPMGMFTTDAKYISRIQLRLFLEPGARLTVSICYDRENRWEHLCTLRGSHLRSFTLPIRPKRCDHMMLRLEGEGMAKLYSLTKVWEEGSDGP